MATKLTTDELADFNQAIAHQEEEERVFMLFDQHREAAEHLAVIQPALRALMALLPTSTDEQKAPMWAAKMSFLLHEVKQALAMQLFDDYCAAGRTVEDLNGVYDRGL